MTTATVVFDPFSEDFFKDPYEIYRRMREEAPVYYSAEYDFYALTRHEDVAAAYQGLRDILLGLWSGPRSGAQGRGHRARIDHRHGPARAPAHARAAQQGVHPARDPGAAAMVAQLVDKHLSAVDPDGFDFVQDFSALFPVDVMTSHAGRAGARTASRSGCGSTTCCTAKPVRSR